MAVEDFDELMQFQRQMASRVVQENEMDLQLRMLEIIGSMVRDKNKQIQKAKILVVAEMEGIAEDQAARILKILEDLSYIKQVSPGYYKRLQ